MVELLKAIADENRYKILELLLQNRHCVGALSRKLNISESAVSQHLKVLRAQGIVSGEKVGYFMHYQVNKDKLQEIVDFVGKLLTIETSEKLDSCPHKMVNQEE